MTKTIKDQLGRTIVLPSWPFRIISLVPSEIELLVDLDLEKYIVGVNKFCVHPNHIKTTKEIVGGTKNISLEKIKKLKPNIILCNKEENTKDIVFTLEKEYEVHVSDVKNMTNVFHLIQQYANLFNCNKKALEISSNIKIELNGFSNACNNKERYPIISVEEIQENTAELVLLSSEPYPFSEKYIPEIKSISVSGKIVLVDGEYFSCYGSRLQSAFTYFKKLNLSI